MSLKPYYTNQGYLLWISDTDSGETIAVFQHDGTLHPNYQDEEAIAAAAQFPYFDETKIKADDDNAIE